MPEQLGHFQSVSRIGRIEPGLIQCTVLIEKHLTVSAYGLTVFTMYVGIYGIEHHADAIVHVGKAPRLIPSAVKPMAGHPCIGFAGHFQKVAGMHREYAGLLHDQRIQSVGQLCENSIVPIMPIDAELSTEFSDDAAGLLIFGAAYSAALAQDLQIFFRHGTAVARHGNMQCCAEILQLLTAEYLGSNVQQRESRFIYRVRLNREGLIAVEDDGLLRLVPVRVTPQQRNQVCFRCLLGCQISHNTFLRKALFVFIHDFIKLIFQL